MATVTESAVGVDIALTRNGDQVRVMLSGTSLADVDGVMYAVRSFRDEDVTAIVPPELLPHVLALLDAAEAYVKARYGIA